MPSRLTCLCQSWDSSPLITQITEPSWVVHQAFTSWGSQKGWGCSGSPAEPPSVSSPQDSGSCTSDEGHHGDLSGYEVTYTFNKLQLCK